MKYYEKFLIEKLVDKYIKLEEKKTNLNFKTYKKVIDKEKKLWQN